MTKRFQLCQLPGPAEGVFNPETEALPNADFRTKGEALDAAAVFPGKGFGYVWDHNERRAVHIFSWARSLPAN